MGVLAGNGQRGSSDGVGSNAAFSLPRDVAIDPQQGNSEDMYVADYANCAVRRLDAKTSNVESTTGHCATSRTSEMICPPVGDIVTIIRFAPSTDQGTDNSIRFRLGWNIGSGTNEGWGPYQVRPGPFPKTPGDGSDPNYVWDETNTREWNYTSAEIPNAIRIETMGDVNPAGSGDDPYVGVLEVSNLCGANFPIFNEMDDYGNTFEALPIGQEKTYTWTQLERSPFLTTGPVSVSVLRLAREGGGMRVPHAHTHDWVEGCQGFLSLSPPPLLSFLLLCVCPPPLLSSLLLFFSPSLSCPSHVWPPTPPAAV